MRYKDESGVEWETVKGDPFKLRSVAPVDGHDLEIAVEPDEWAEVDDSQEAFLVVVSASRLGMRLGQTCLGGIDVSDDSDPVAWILQVVNWHGLTTEAVYNAKNIVKALAAEGAE